MHYDLWDVRIEYTNIIISIYVCLWWGHRIYYIDSLGLSVVTDINWCTSIILFDYMYILYDFWVGDEIWLIHVVFEMMTVNYFLFLIITWIMYVNHSIHIIIGSGKKEIGFWFKWFESMLSIVINLFVKFGTRLIWRLMLVLSWDIQYIYI